MHACCPLVLSSRAVQHVTLTLTLMLTLMLTLTTLTLTLTRSCLEAVLSYIL